MKAKEYTQQVVAKFDTNSNPEEVLAASVEVSIAIVTEISSLIKERNVRTDHGIKSIVDEMRAKWYSFVSQMIMSKLPGVDYIPLNGFDHALSMFKPVLAVRMRGDNYLQKEPAGPHSASYSGR